MDYFQIYYKYGKFEAYQRDTPMDCSPKLTAEQMIPVSSPKIVYARFDDLRTIVEKLYPEVKADGRIANAFMHHELKDDNLTRIIQFYLIPTK
jgi:hypothetical protein